MCGRFIIQPDEYYQDLVGLVEEIERVSHTSTDASNHKSRIP